MNAPSANPSGVTSPGRALRAAGLARRPLLVAAAVLLAGAILSVLAFALIHSMDRQQRRWQFEREAEHLADVVQLNFQFPLEILPALAAFFESSHDVTRDEFADFIHDALARHKGIYSIEWIPLVPSNQRVTMEQAARQDGLSDFTFQELGPDGTLQVAATRADYLPIYYQVPAGPAIGLNVATAQTRTAVNQAIESNELVASRMFRLVDQPDRGDAVVFYKSVLRTGSDSRPQAGCAGLVGLVLLIDPIMTQVLASNPMSGVVTVLQDVTAGSDPTPLATSLPNAPTIVQESGMTWTTHIPLADREWAVTVAARPGTRWTAVAAWPELVYGLAISLLAAVGTFSVLTAVGMRQNMARALHLGQYTLEQKIGEGGMGEVYRAGHTMLRRPTAIKLLPLDKHNEIALARFEREVQLTSQLTHPNTIVVYDYGRTEDDVFYYAMELVEGVDLDAIVKNDGPQAAGRVIHILRQVAGSLDEAHQSGLIHRDIKPGNIMVSQRPGQFDVVKVLDFGLVKDLKPVDADPALTMQGALPGTPMYTSPEAALGTHPVDARSDIYSLGAVGYYLLTGNPVFTTASLIELLHAHAELQPVTPSKRLGASVPDDLEQLILECLAKNPADRPATAEAMSDRLSQCGQHAPWTRADADAWWQSYSERFGDDRDPAAAEAETDSEPLGSVQRRI